MTGGVRRSGRTRRLGLLAVFVVAAALVAGTAYAGPANEDHPGNYTYGVLSNGNPSTDCLKCHRSWGMTDSHIVLPMFPKEIRRGEPAMLRLQVENPWKYDIVELKVQLNLTGEDLFLVPTVGSAAEATPPFHNAWFGTLGNPQAPAIPGAQLVPASSTTVALEVEPGAVAILATLDLVYPEGTGAALANRFAASVLQPGRTTGHPWEESGQDTSLTHHDLVLPRGDGASYIGTPSGTWKFQLDFGGGDAPTVDWALSATVLYGKAGAAVYDVHEQLRDPPQLENVPAKILGPYAASDVIEIPILGIKEGTQHVEARVTAMLYYDHTGATVTQDWFHRYATADIIVGDRYVPSDMVASAGGKAKSDLYLVAGEVTGFSAAILLVPSLVFGGTYGRASRQFLNHVLGGAKRRVMFHNLLSMGLTLVALAHIVFFLLEVRYTVLMGVLFGGIATLSLLVLGLTGYYQVPLIQKYGYNWWRTVHLVFGILVIVSVAYHAVADGADFGSVKERLPEWINDLNLATQ